MQRTLRDGSGGKWGVKGGGGGGSDLAGRAVRVISMRHHSCFRRHVLEGLAEDCDSVFKITDLGLCRTNRRRGLKEAFRCRDQLQHR